MAERKRKRPPGSAKRGRPVGSIARGPVSEVNPLGLAPQFLRLVDCYFSCGFNKTLASIEAGFANEGGGYTDRLFKRPDVQAEIIRRQQMAQRFHEIDKELIEDRLGRVAMTNVGLMIKKLQDNDWDLDCLTEDELYMIESLDIEQAMVGRGEDKIAIRKIKFKPQNRQNAKQLLARMQGWMAKDGDDDGDIINEIYAARPDLKPSAEAKKARKEAQEEQKKKATRADFQEEDEDGVFGDA